MADTGKKGVNDLQVVGRKNEQRKQLPVYAVREE
jgi:hypothetical protein